MRSSETELLFRRIKLELDIRKHTPKWAHDFINSLMRRVEDLEKLVESQKGEDLGAANRRIIISRGQGNPILEVSDYHSVEFADGPTTRDRLRVSFVHEQHEKGFFVQIGTSDPLIIKPHSSNRVYIGRKDD